MIRYPFSSPCGNTPPDNNPQLFPFLSTSPTERATPPPRQQAPRQQHLNMNTILQGITDFATATNTATLSGAIDVIAVYLPPAPDDPTTHAPATTYVTGRYNPATSTTARHNTPPLKVTVVGEEHPTGNASTLPVLPSVTHRDMQCTPFHVRFGAMSGLLHPKERVVQVACNGVKSNLKMKLDEHGEAFFVYETNVRPQDLDDMATSPIVSPLTSPVRSSPRRNTDGTLAKEQHDVLPHLSLDVDGHGRRVISPALSDDASTGKGGALSPPLVQFTNQQLEGNATAVKPINTIKLSAAPLPPQPRPLLPVARTSKFAWRWREAEEDAALPTTGKGWVGLGWVCCCRCGRCFR